MKQDMYLSMRLEHVNVDQILVFVMINNIGIAINVGVNVGKIIDKGRCKYRFIWNPSICECDKSCDIRVNLDYENCKCRKRLIDKLVEQ